MITLLLLLTITLMVLLVGLFLLSIGGSLFVILFSDIIVAIAVIWLLYRIFQKKKK